jgi:hypothetical protein
MPYLSKFRPFPVTFPYPQAEGECELITKPLVQQLADVFNGRIFQEIVPGTMIEVRQRFPENSLHIREIHHHAVANVAVCYKLDFIGVTVNRAAFGMIGKEVGTVDVLNDTDFHDA